MQSSSTQHETLWRQTESLRGLIAALVQDPHAVEDVLQQTRLVALSQPSDPEDSDRWLAGVARRLASRWGRTAIRRRQRESLRALSLEQRDQWPERAQSLRALLNALEQLKDPYRRVVSLRYIDGIPPRIIAQESDLPLTTVKSQLKRGLQKLRDALDDERAGCPGWRASLLGLPLLRSAKATQVAALASTPVLGVLVMKLVSVLIVSTLAISFWWISKEETPEHDLPAPFSQTKLTSTSSSSRSESVGELTKLASVPYQPPVPSTPAAQVGTQGKVVVIEDNGEELSALTGYIEYKLGDAGQAIRAPIKEGHFAWPEASPGITVLDCRANGKIAWPAKAKVQKESPTIQCRWAHPITLRVIDKATQQPLENIEIRSGRPLWVNEDAGDSIHLISAKTSPIVIQPKFTLRRWDGSSHYFVRAENHAWAEVELDHVQSGNATVGLDPASGLSITINGGKHRHLSVTLNPQGAGRFTNPRLSTRIKPNATNTFENAPVGTWELIIGDSNIRHETGSIVQAAMLHKGLVTIKALEHKSLEFNFSDGTPPKSRSAAPIAGTIHIPDGWPLHEAKLLIIGPGSGTRGPRHYIYVPLSGLRKLGDDTYAFATTEFASGKLNLSLDACSWATDVEIPETGNADLNLSVPRPNIMRVSLRDSKTGQLIENGELSFSVHATGSRKQLGALSNAPKDGDAFRVLSPNGRLTFMAKAPGYDMKFESREMEQCPPLLDIELDRSTGLRFIVREGKRRIPYSPKWNMKLEPLDGGTVKGSGIDHYKVSQAGKYRLSMRAPEGFEPVAPLDLVIEAGQVLEVEIQLQRPH